MVLITGSRVALIESIFMGFASLAPADYVKTIVTSFSVLPLFESIQAIKLSMVQFAVLVLRLKFLEATFMLSMLFEAIDSFCVDMIGCFLVEIQERF